jgi:RND family efflux transporter MFP subunit
LIVAVCLLAGCKREAATPAQLARVRAVTAELTDFAPTVTFTGVIAAQVQNDLSFRLTGKIRERLANIGDHVGANQVLARLDPDEQEVELQAATAAVQSAEALAHQTTAAFERQRDLLRSGTSTRREFDQADANQRSALAQLDQARSQLASARDQLAFTELRAGFAGTIVGRSAEAGQVVAQAQPVYTLAQDGPRDAIFNVHEWALANVALDRGLAVSLVADSSVRTTGKVRLISPAVDPSSMTIAIRFGLSETPAAMVPGSLVNGMAPLKPQHVFLLPWEAVFESDGRPAVWIVDKQGGAVALKPVVIHRYSREAIAVSGGIVAGDTVVTAGGQMLHPGQKVEVVAEARP